MDEPQHCYRHPNRETRLACSECGRPICYECMTPAPVGQRCPEHSGKPQGVRKVTRAAERAVRGDPWSVAAATRALIALNVGVYLAELAAGGDFNGTGNWIYEHGVLVASATYGNGSAAGVAHGEWWRLITAAFLHYGPFHLGVNMLGLYFIGNPLERLIGRWRFLLLYVASGLAGSAGALVAQPGALTAGASGAIFGIAGALLVLERRGGYDSGGQLLAILVLNLVITFQYRGSISLGGHVGGLIGGVVAMALLLPVRRSSALSLAVLVGVAVASVVVAYAAV